MNDLDKVSGRIQKNLNSFESNFNKILPRMHLSYAWLNYYWDIASSNRAKHLLVGSKIALLEAATSWAIGSNRGAAASIRTYIESLCAWIYYKDHHVEYDLVHSHDDDLLLPKAVRSYASKIDKGFDSAHSLLFKFATRSEDYYYSTISNFIHAHPTHTEGKTDIHSIIVAHPVDKSFLDICSGIDEFISDIYLTINRSHWDNVPHVVQENATDRMKDKLTKFLNT